MDHFCIVSSTPTHAVEHALLSGHAGRVLTGDYNFKCLPLFFPFSFSPAFPSVSPSFSPQVPLSIRHHRQLLGLPCRFAPPDPRVPPPGSRHGHAARHRSATDALARSRSPARPCARRAGGGGGGWTCHASVSVGCDWYIYPGLTGLLTSWDLQATVTFPSRLPRKSHRPVRMDLSRSLPFTRNQHL